MTKAIPKRGVLSRLFGKIIFVGAMGGAMVDCNGGNIKPKELTGDQFSQRDISWLYNLFTPDGIDMCSVRKFHENEARPNATSSVVATANTDMQVRFYRNWQSTDYSRDMNYQIFSVFTHELFHIRDFQKIGYFNMTQSPSGYYYPLGNGQPLSSYPIEMRAAAFQDWASLELHPAHRGYWYSFNSTMRDQLRTLIESSIPGTTEMRLGYSDATFANDIPVQSPKIFFNVVSAELQQETNPANQNSLPTIDQQELESRRIARPEFDQIAHTHETENVSAQMQASNNNNNTTSTSASMNATYCIKPR